MDYFVKSEGLRLLTSSIDEIHKRYITAKPFPHIVLDDFIEPDKLNQVLESFPDPGQTQWWAYNNQLEKKLAKDNLETLSAPIRYLINELMERRFVTFLEKLTGIDGLIVDHSLNGGGLHQIMRGGKLDIHADYNYHPVNKLDRRLNVLVYLNKNWEKNWGGQLEFWDSEMKERQASIEPLFNRMVIFSTTDVSYHGHPDPMTCPPSLTRKSIALYYYTNGRPEHERSAPHSTIFKRRPQDPIDAETEELRQKRSVRRVT